MSRDTDDLDIAVIGMSGRFPGARNLLEYWTNLRDGVDSITTLSDEALVAEGVAPRLLREPRYVKAASMLDDVDMFDAAFFGYSPKEAELMDPQARLFLEVAWEAFENAGYTPPVAGRSVGVFAAASLNTYLLHHLRAGLDFQSFVLSGGNLPTIVGNTGDFLPTRVSYKLDLRGPSVNVQTACSSSLVAIHLARQSLLNGECDMALAGGVSVYLPQRVGYHYDEGMILSPDGRCRPFDAGANGTIFGRGVGVVLLKPLADALAAGDPIRAVLKGSAINNDGADKVGFTAPGVTGQAQVIADALANAGVHPDTIGYVEAHGTGTRQGDPIEVAALTQAFGRRTARRGFCALGTVKANIGHLDVASGVAGFIKTVLALEHGRIPPSPHFAAPNPQIDFAASPFFVNTALREWPEGDAPRRAGVSSFGMGGTNAHVVLEQAPTRPALAPAAGPQVLMVSARDETALRELAGRWAGHLDGRPEAALTDVCFTATAGRGTLPERVAWVVGTLADARAALAGYAAGESPAGTVRGRATTSPAVAFVFPGQGAHYAGMGGQLYRAEPAFRAALQECEAALGSGLRPAVAAVLRGEAADVDATADAQPALFAIAYGVAAVWRAWGVQPAYVMGHSVGEFVAACLAGALDVGDAIRLVTARGRLMQALPTDGSMAAVFAPEADVAAVVARRPDALALAAVNGPRDVVIAGGTAAVDEAVRSLEAGGIATRRLRVGHAFHSPLMDPMLAELEATASGIRSAPPRPGWVSTLTGELVTTAPDAAYWRRQARQPVQYARAVERLEQLGVEVFVEVGPGATLTALAARRDTKALWVASVRAGRDEVRSLLESAAAVATRGVAVDWARVGGERGRRVELPTYPFRRKRYWAMPPATTTAPVSAEADGHPLLGRRIHSAAIEGALFESRLSLQRLPFLGDHRVFGAAVLPATAYLEMARAAATAVWGTGAHAVEDVTIVEALTLSPDGGRLAQLVLEAPASGCADFRLLSRDAAASDDVVTWTLHATGRLIRQTATIPGDAGVAAPTGLDEVDVAAWYARLVAQGLDYGPSFRGLESLWLGDGEAVGEVRAPVGVAADAGSYALHPAVLDACLHTVAAVLAGGAEPGPARTYLPLAVEHCRLIATTSPRLRAHARVHRDGGDVARAEVRVTDGEGRLVADVRGLRLRRVGAEAFRTAAGVATDGWLYEVAWRAEPEAATEPAAASCAAIAASVRPRLAGLEAEHAIEDYRALLPRLDTLSLGYVRAAFDELGWRPRAGERVTTAALARDLGVVPAHHRLLGRLLEMLAEDGIVRPLGDGWQVQSLWEAAPDRLDAVALAAAAPAGVLPITVTARCGENLGAVLRGTCDPLSLLFPGGSLELLERLYEDAPFTRFNNAVVREAVAAAVARLPAGRPLRVLEIGAGTGATTAQVLPVLPAERTEYVFTDVSPAFTSRARRKFGAYPFLRYELLNVETDPDLQGFAGRRFDLVLAANVLHATRDLRQTLTHTRRLLADGGLLVLLEGTGRQRWVDLTFGMTDGWWRFTDTGLRGTYPLISRASWLALLAELGFDEGQAFPEPERGEGDRWQTLIVARAGQTVRAAGPASTWLILGDPAGAGARLAARVRAGGDAAVLVRPGAACAMPGDDAWQADPTEPEQVRRVVAAACAGAAPCRHVVHLWGAEPPDAEAMTVDELRRFEQAACGSAVEVVRALAAAAPTVPRLWLVTRGAQPVTPGDVAPAAATLWGLGQVIAQEHPELASTCVDLDPAGPADEADALYRAIERGDRELRVGFRSGRRHVARLVRLPPAPPEPPAGGSRTLAISTRGALDTLVMRPAPRRAPEPDEVEIEVRATGLNFKDVLNALGVYPGEAGPLGNECAGTVVAAGSRVTALSAGDEVVGLATGSFGRYVTTPAALVAPRPPALSLEAAATIPVVFLTAHEALVRLAGLAAGERVLIHSAAGGVGLAAVQLARRVGAEIFATAGTPDKRRYLESLGIRHVMSSRSADFVAEIMAATGGRGVDVVLSALAGELAVASRSVLAAGGRFVEIGKAAVLPEAERGRLGQGRAYHVLDVGAEAARDPARIGAVLADLMAEAAAGRLAPLPARTFPIDDIVGAFRAMARARHAGKLVVTQPPRSRAAVPGLSFRAEATYLLTGGLGGLGLLVADWMVGRGARHLVLVGRGAPSAQADAAVRRLQERGARVVVLQADVGRDADVERVLAAVAASLPPLAGVVHGAGVLDDGVLSAQSWARFATVFAAKVDGAFLLHERTRHLPLDFFVLFSSIASLLGSPGQANHAAANAFLDALAHHRRAQGLPALSINWGPWAEVGAAAERHVLERLRAQGIVAIPSAAGLAILAALMAHAPAQVGVVPMDWADYLEHLPAGAPPMLAELASERPTRPAVARVAERPGGTTPDVRGRLAQLPVAHRRSALLAEVQDQVAKGLGFDPAQPIDARQPFSELGLDSLLAVELRNLIGRRLGLERSLPATTLFDYPTLETLTGHLLAAVLGLAGDAGPTAPAEVAPPPAASLQGMTDDEAERLLIQELDALDAGRTGRA
jgi:acyl transferase domain-containing protein/protein-L-isoaspartate O-methyltransferase